MDGAAIAQALERHSWCVLPAFFDAALVARLARDCRERDAAHALAPAATGRGAGRTHSVLRGDRTQWFDTARLSAAQADYWARMDALRIDLNRRLMLGLDELEAQYALYPPGSGYARHRDRFRDDDARVVSSVAYLNPDWRDADGGALRLHLPQGPHDVAPLGGTLALFLSAEIEHEVLPATRERLSIAGWFRRR
ncbi:MAG TPA: 2OG-Fe(II) oxygenase [Tahibacter sp.]|nr:2OG-Fe(II) oxygenase [Tahibacter sp.]